MFRRFDPDDGLNRLATVNGTAATYDADGNPSTSLRTGMTADPVTAKTYLYFSSNGLLRNTPSPWTSLDYDAFDRLLFTEYPTTYYVFDAASGGGGNNPIAQYDASNVLQKRFVFDDRGSPLVEYDASGNRTFLESDERGSVIALANDSAVVTAINTYDEYGVPSATNQGTFQYTGAMWLSGPALYLNGLRDYGAHLGRFNQTDPMGYSGDGPNLYAYVLNDPVNRTDPLGLAIGTSIEPGIFTNCTGDFCNSGPPIIVVGDRCRVFPNYCNPTSPFGSSLTGGIGSADGGSKERGDGNGGPPCQPGINCKTPTLPNRCPISPVSSCALQRVPPPPKPKPICPNFSQTQFAVDVGTGAVTGLLKSIRQAEFAVLLGGGIGTAIEPGGGTVVGAASGIGIALGILGKNVVAGAALGAAKSAVVQCGL